MIRIYNKPILYIKQFYKELIDYFDNRITKMAYDAMETGKLEILIVSFDESSKNKFDILVGISCVYMDDKNIPRGVTIVKTNYRNRGIGTKMLIKRNKLYPDVKSIVYEKNYSSMRMCEKAKMIKTGNFKKMIRNEERNIITLKTLESEEIEENK